MPKVKRLLKQLENYGGSRGPGIGNLGSGNPSVKPLTKKKIEKLTKRALNKSARKAARKVRRDWSSQFDRPFI